MEGEVEVKDRVDVHHQQQMLLVLIDEDYIKFSYTTYL